MFIALKLLSVVIHTWLHFGSMSLHHYRIYQNEKCLCICLSLVWKSSFATQKRCSTWCWGIGWHRGLNVHSSGSSHSQSGYLSDLGLRLARPFPISTFHCARVNLCSADLCFYCQFICAAVKRDGELPVESDQIMSSPSKTGLQWHLPHFPPQFSSKSTLVCTGEMVCSRSLWLFRSQLLCDWHCVMNLCSLKVSVFSAFPFSTSTVLWYRLSSVGLTLPIDSKSPAFPNIAASWWRLLSAKSMEEFYFDEWDGIITKIVTLCERLFFSCTAWMKSRSVNSHRKMKSCRHLAQNLHICSPQKQNTLLNKFFHLLSYVM